MSTISISDLQYISREALASSFTAAPSSSAPPPPAASAATTRRLPAHTAVIDVRDSDHIGGHIRGSTWIPSSTLDYRLPELLRTLRDKDTVVFHCALSQQRGPSAALRYLRERERLRVGSGVESEGADSGHGAVDPAKKQSVFVLQGGFTMWQEIYGEDDELTEGYERDIWAFGE